MCNAILDWEFPTISLQFRKSADVSPYAFNCIPASVQLALPPMPRPILWIMMAAP